jgi:CheY-like chemotaxis protein
MQRFQRWRMEAGPTPEPGKSRRQFLTYFPISCLAGAPALLVHNRFRARPLALDRPKASRALVYVVDDVPECAFIAGWILEPAGYHVATFTDRWLALQTFLCADPRPGLLITCQLGGAITGVELIAQCKAAQPELKTLMVSGLPKEAIQGYHIQPDRFLEKPYDPAQLLAHVRLLVTT